ncbi:hypothetical protein [Natronorubrum daqingense]|uniref:Uncharacterized protein n=1 Tax=Natronorubrum daqingense TaxID=588898 RepID=A0A1N7G6H3_9EURY|nr:hypothetical protein [Natronorubrum daqingense]APX98692.1 hypothetical protein BB347_18460 [Natronorubrum daqingense]SIS08162.1 hypothetical protein SAMN05421809_3769 [Natronorubrum daqingense]
MPLQSLRNGVRKLFVDVPIGAYYWFSGALLAAGWYIPGLLGVDFASKARREARIYRQKGRERMF